MSLSATDSLNIIGYYGEMELSTAEKKVRIVMAEQLQGTVSKYYDTVRAILADDKASKRKKDLLLAAAVISLKNTYLALFNKYYPAYINAAGTGSGESYSAADAWKRRRAYDFALWITQTAQREPNLAFSESHAAAVTRTEVNAVCNLAAMDAAYRQGKRFKTWKTFGDVKVRPSHKAANGQRVPLDMPFTVGGYEMMFPNDSSLGAPAGEVVNCRCVLEFDDGKVLTNGNERGIINKSNRMGAPGSADFLDYPVLEDLESVKNFKKFAAEQLGIEHIRGIELLKNGNSALEIVKPLKQLMQQYQKRFSQITIMDFGKSKTVAETLQNELRINSQFANRPEALAAILNSWEKSGYIPKGCNNAAYVGRHEFYHLLTQDLINDPKSIFFTELNRAVKGNCKCVSENATYNYHEFTADLFAAKVLDKKQTALKHKLSEIIKGG